MDPMCLCGMTLVAVFRLVASARHTPNQSFNQGHITLYSLELLIYYCCLYDIENGYSKN